MNMAKRQGWLFLVLPFVALLSLAYGNDKPVPCDCPEGTFCKLPELCCHHCQTCAHGMHIGQACGQFHDQVCCEKPDMVVVDVPSGGQICLPIGDMEKENLQPAVSVIPRREGDSLTLHCFVALQNVSTNLDWKVPKHGRTQSRSISSRERENGVIITTSTLIVRNITVDDFGEYRCSAYVRETHAKEVLLKVVHADPVSYGTDLSQHNHVGQLCTSSDSSVPENKSQESYGGNTVLIALAIVSCIAVTLFIAFTCVVCLKRHPEWGPDLMHKFVRILIPDQQVINGGDIEMNQGPNAAEQQKEKFRKEKKKLRHNNGKQKEELEKYGKEVQGQKQELEQMNVTDAVQKEIKEQKLYIENLKKESTEQKNEIRRLQKQNEEQSNLTDIVQKENEEQRQDIVKLKKESTEQKNEIRRLKKQNEEQSNVADTVQKENEEQRRDIDKLKKESTEQKNEIRRLQKQNEEQSNLTDTVQKENEEQRQDMDKLKKENGEQKDEIRRLQKQNEEQRNVTDTVQKENEEQRRDIDKLKKESTEQKNEIRRFKKQNEEQSNVADTVQKENEEQRQDMDKLKKENEEQRYEIRKLRKQMEKQHCDTDVVRKENEEQKDEIKNLKMENTEQKDEIKTLRKQMEKQNCETDVVQKENEEQKHEIEALKKKNTEQAGEISKLRKTSERKEQQERTNRIMEDAEKIKAMSHERETPMEEHNIINILTKKLEEIIKREFQSLKKEKAVLQVENLLLKQETADDRVDASVRRPQEGDRLQEMKQADAKTVSSEQGKKSCKAVNFDSADSRDSAFHERQEDLDLYLHENPPNSSEVFETSPTLEKGLSLEEVKSRMQKTLMLIQDENCSGHLKSILCSFFSYPEYRATLGDYLAEHGCASETEVAELIIQ